MSGEALVQAWKIERVLKVYLEKIGVKAVREWKKNLGKLK